MKTTVQFLLETEVLNEGATIQERQAIQHHRTPQVFAYFPLERWDRQGNRTAYAVGEGHTACSADYAKECRPASVDQYGELKQELESMGYELNIQEN